MIRTGTRSGKIPEKTARRSTKLMQLNYSHLKICKLKIHSSSLSLSLSLFLVTFFCAHVTWWQDFATLNIRGFSLPFFRNENSPIFTISFFEKKSPLNWSKIQTGFVFQNSKVVKRGNFVKDMKIFTQNKEAEFY